MSVVDWKHPASTDLTLWDADRFSDAAGVVMQSDSVSQKDPFCLYRQAFGSAVAPPPRYIRPTRVARDDTPLLRNAPFGVRAHSTHYRRRAGRGATCGQSMFPKLAR